MLVHWIRVRSIELQDHAIGDSFVYTDVVQHALRRRIRYTLRLWAGTGAMCAQIVRHALLRRAQCRMVWDHGVYPQVVCHALAARLDPRGGVRAVTRRRQPALAAGIHRRKQYRGQHRSQAKSPPPLRDRLPTLQSTLHHRLRFHLVVRAHDIVDILSGKRLTTS
jgi:hypothetical protein